VEDLTLTTRGGALQARLFQPTASPRGLIVYLHGGGWVLGGIDDFDTLARTLVAQSGCAVLLPDYRLAPEHPFPAAIEDCEDAITEAAARSSSWLGHPVPLVVAGDSAGANLATVAAARLYPRVALALQALIYPVTDCDFNRPSYGQHATGLPLTARDMRWFFEHYAPPDRWSDPLVSPLRAPNLSVLPPTYVAIAAYDVLRDEGEAYAQRLQEAGVPVTLRIYDDLAHGFIRLHNLVDSSARAVSDLADAIRVACVRGSATDLHPAGALNAAKP
jgi:acetyl esterase